MAYKTVKEADVEFIGEVFMKIARRGGYPG
jgi:hypothetical protein